MSAVTLNRNKCNLFLLLFLFSWSQRTQTFSVHMKCFSQVLSTNLSKAVIVSNSHSLAVHSTGLTPSDHVTTIFSVFTSEIIWDQPQLLQKSAWTNYQKSSCGMVERIIFVLNMQQVKEKQKLLGLNTAAASSSLSKCLVWWLKPLPFLCMHTCIKCSARQGIKLISKSIFVSSVPPKCLSTIKQKSRSWIILKAFPF